VRLDPAIAALLADPAPVAGASSAASGLAPRLAKELARFGGGEGLDHLPTLAETFSATEAAASLTTALLRSTPTTLSAAPLAYWSWRHFSNGVLHSAVIAASGRASLSLVLIDGAAWSAARDSAAPEWIAFQPGELHAAILAGSGAARIMRNDSADPARAVLVSRPLRLENGARYRLDGEREALVLDAVDGPLLTLRLHRRAERGAIARQYDAADGRMVHQAAGDAGASRAELAMALLRAMGRADAAPLFARRAREGSSAARWQALRECLALDSAVGFAALAETARRVGDPLAGPARALVDTLAARDPAFDHARETLLCPA